MINSANFSLRFHEIDCLLEVKGKLLNVIVGALLLSLFQLRAQAQTTDVTWNLDATISNVNFYHSITDCNGRKAVLLKFNNKNSYAVKVSWKEVFATQEGPNVEGSSGLKSIELPIGETAETDCNNPAHPQLLVLSQQVKPTYVATISRFDYKTISVTKIN